MKSLIAFGFLACVNAIAAQMSVVTDRETETTFQYPSNYQIEHSDVWLIGSNGHALDGVIYWNVFNTDYFTGTIKERCTAFGSNLAAADGLDGGTISAPKYLGMTRAKSGDDVLLFELKLKAYGHSAQWNGNLIGYMLGVDLKPNGKKKYRHLLVYSPQLEVLRAIAESINVPKASSVK